MYVCVCPYLGGRLEPVQVRSCPRAPGGNVIMVSIIIIIIIIIIMLLISIIFILG